MSDPQFFSRPAGLSIAEIARLAGAPTASLNAAERRIVGIAALDEAGPDDLAFCDNQKFVADLSTTRAGACLVSPRFAEAVPDGVAGLVVGKPYPAFVAVGRALFPDALRPSPLFVGATHAGAHVDPAARLEAGVTIGPAAVVGARAEIGSGTVIGPGAVIGPEVRIGRNCGIGAGVTITHALIGDHVIIHPGCRIGQDGFGFAPGPKGFTKIPQIGRVIVQDHVEIGANSTIDRGGVRDTVIGEGTKIDNLVQIGHNTSIGRNCILVAQTGISGSVKVGDGVLMGGQVGVADNVSIGAGATLAAKTGVMADIAAGDRVAGSPARSAQQWLRESVILERLSRRSPRSGEPQS